MVYDTETMLADVGGFLALFLGFSILGTLNYVRELFKSAISRSLRQKKVAQKYALLNVPIDITCASEVIAQRPCLVGVIANIRTKRIDRAQDRH